MISRRHTLTQMIGLAALGGFATSSLQAQESCAVFTKESQSTTTPDAALKRLIDGNARFVAGKTINCDLMKQVKDTASQQSPIAAIVGCIDSRVPPELVFDQRIGDIFAARIAGNFVNTDILGSLEFATVAAGAKLIVVLGHTECGAIKGAVDEVKLGHLTSMLSNIRPSLSKLQYTGVASSKNKELVQKLADQNAKDAAAMIMDKSPVIADLVKAGKVKIVSAMHDIGTGKISFFASFA
ncbi:MAG: carbonic anhydrase family protein [Cytophagales bacterium]|nr:carbonic anhydrase family protein [Cytophagales bacterium]